jgi:hypothetical protein
VDDLELIGRHLLKEWVRNREAEREIIRCESEIQTALARRRWSELQGQATEVRLNQHACGLAVQPAQSVVAISSTSRDADAHSGPARTKARAPCRGAGGRPKSLRVIQLAEDAMHVHISALNHLIRNGLGHQAAAKQIRGWSAKDIVRRINEERGRNHPLSGPKWPTIYKQIQRWREDRNRWALSTDWEDPEEELSGALRRDGDWGRANGLNVPR